MDISLKRLCPSGEGGYSFFFAKKLPLFSLITTKSRLQYVIINREKKEEGGEIR